MDLYMVRHAIAHVRDAGRWPDDHKRPLTAQGEKRFRSVARGLASMVRPVDVVLSSPATRARQTASLLEEEAHWPEPQLSNQLAPGQTPAAALKALLSHASADSIAIVGHEPGLSELVAFFLVGRRDETLVQFKKGGVACLRFQAEPKAASGTLLWLAQPGLLRKLDE